MHKDVKDTIYSYRLEEILKDSKAGKYIDPEYVVDTLSIGLSVNHDSYIELSEKYKKLYEKYQDAAKTLIQLNKRYLRERRIVDLFLRNQGVLLDLDYEKFEARIYDKLYEKGLI